MNIFARFDENPAMTLRVIKETKRYGWTDGRTDGRTDNVKTVYPLQTKFAGGIKKKVFIIIMSLWEQMTPMKWPIWTHGAWLAGFTKGNTKHCKR